MNKKAFGTSELTVVLIAINIILLVSVIIVGINISKEKPEEETGLIGEFGVGEGEIIQRAPSKLTSFNGKPIVRAGPLSIDEIRLCKSITNGICEESSTFGINEDIGVLVIVSGFQQTDTEDGWFLGLNEYYETFDAEGKSISDMKDFLQGISEFNPEKKNKFVFESNISTFLRLPGLGTYTFEFEIEDDVTGNKVKKKKDFEIVK